MQTINLVLQLLSKCNAHLNFNENILLKKIMHMHDENFNKP